MNRVPAPASPARSPLAGRTARDLMTTDPASLPEGATVGQVVAFLDEVPFGTAPVTDDAGHPVGVISRIDVLNCQPGQAPASTATPQSPPAAASQGRASVRANDLMSPTVFSVVPETPAEEVAAQMVQLNVHRLFVVDQDGVLVGVVSALDLLRQLHE